MEKNEDPRIAEKWVFGVPLRPGPYFYGPNWHTSHVMWVVLYVISIGGCQNGKRTNTNNNTPAH